MKNIKRKKIKWCFVLLILVSLKAKSSVNMKDASFFEKWNDGIIERTYHSRSLYNGLFGFGWCSNLEKRIEIEEDKITLRDCTLSHEINFEKEKFPEKIQEKIRYINKYQDMEILFKRNQFVLLKNNKEQSKFDFKGRLVYLASNPSIKIFYNKEGLIEKMVSDLGRNTKVKFGNKKEKIVSAISQDGEIYYGYYGRNLVLVKKNKNNNTYKYDSLHNLIKITYSDNSSKEMVYDKREDRVIKIKKRNFCLKEFKYSVEKNNNGDYLSTGLIEKCGDIVRNNEKYEFWHERSEELKKVFLKRARITKNNKKPLELVFSIKEGRQYNKKSLTNKYLNFRRKI